MKMKAKTENKSSLTKWHFIFASFVVLSIAIVMSSYAPAISQSKGSYMVSAEDATFVWRINMTDGSISYCQRPSQFTTDPSQIRRLTPGCSQATGAASH